MNANKILTDDMTLEEKLSAIEKAMQNAQGAANEQAARRGTYAVALDPAELTMCEGCQ